MTKVDRVASWLLTGRSLTRAQAGRLGFGFSVNDSIYKLRKKGWIISDSKFRAHQDRAWLSSYWMTAEERVRILKQRLSCAASK